MLVLGSSAGAGVGLLAGRIGFSVVSVVFYALTVSGVPADAAAHIALRTSLAAIRRASIVSFVGYWRSGKMDVGFLVVAWGPTVAAPVVALPAPVLFTSDQRWPGPGPSARSQVAEDFKPPTGGSKGR